jgi:hypothetical protein
MDSISRLFQEIPDFGEVLLYAVLVTVMVIAVVIGRLMIRAMVNRRVRGIHAQALDLADLNAIGQKGLLTDEELKQVRRRFAERQLEEMRQADSPVKAKDLLLAIEADPSRATSLLPPSSEHAKRALEGLKRPDGPKSVEDQLRKQLGEAPPAAESPPETAKPDPPREAHPAPLPPKLAEAPGMDLESMLAKGLISRREYELLMARVRKASGD